MEDRNHAPFPFQRNPRASRRPLKSIGQSQIPPRQRKSIRPALATRFRDRFAEAKFPRVSGNPSPRDADLRMGGGRSQGANSPASADIHPPSASHPIQRSIRRSQFFSLALPPPQSFAELPETPPRTARHSASPSPQFYGLVPDWSPSSFAAGQTSS